MKMPELPAVIAGDVFVVTPTTKDDDNGQRKEDGGLKVGVIAQVAGVTGATEVKLTPAQASQLHPIPGDHISWYVEPRLWTMNGNSGITFAYRGAVGIDDLTQLSEAILNAQPANSK